MISFEGILYFQNKNQAKFRFDGEKITISDDGRLVKITKNEIDKKELLGRKTDGKLILFQLSSTIDSLLTPIKGKNKFMLFGNISAHVGTYIDNYCIEHSKYGKMIFNFPELDYFIPSCNACSREKESIVFKDVLNTVAEFSFSYNTKEIKVAFQTFLRSSFGHKSKVETLSNLVLSFEETDDVDFFAALYTFVSWFFGFICNRLNISFCEAKLLNNYTFELPEIDRVKQKVVMGKTKTYPTSAESTFVKVEKYKEPNESDNVICRTVNYGYIKPKIAELFQLLVDDVVSIQSIHPSTKMRNLIDLKQFLHHTSAFERYLREYLPSISTEDSIRIKQEIKTDLLLDNYLTKVTGDKKKVIKGIIKSLDDPTIPLENKLVKVYEGYIGWSPLKPILSEWFGDDISEAAEVANEWRNELAHEKREFEVTRTVITATRLIEHINYCIVLREAGYNDNEIKSILGEILTR